MKTCLIFFVLTIRLAAYSASPKPEQKLIVSRLFSDHIVLQQKTKVNIWGWANPGQKVQVAGTWGKQAAVVAGEDGKWKLKLQTPVAGGPYQISIRTIESAIEIKDVLIGEVWMASGQSNMDIPLKGWPPGDTIFNSAQEIKNADYQAIRFMKVPFGVSATPLDSTGGKWVASSPATAGGFSAAAYFFAVQLHRKLKVPIGIIQSSIGGTPAEAWTSKGYLTKIGDFNKKIAQQDTDRRTPPKINSNSPTVLFNAMINPLIPYTIKGIIWYQGESNVGRAEQYKRLFPNLIEDWRDKWGEVLPFYYVQLAPNNYKAADQHEQGQKIRAAQNYGLKLPKTGMVSTLDIGYFVTSHPPHKQEVGERLARFAFKNEYGYKDMVASGPIFKKVSVSGSNLIVEFNGTGSGLTASAQGLDNFEIAGKDSVYITANAKIENNKVIISSPEVNKPLFVRYAWGDTKIATLFNKEGLPAATFTSEK
ncbi:sialate O-acetylesterase [Mucilaginibacter sp. UYCu711]|uniref:sialate O-acetylesterase n=1 Tax=Mucilaginibacter sp. UYCu711 TaxID=3156339 RepID=UPI003D1BDAB4